ncbi:MAG: hypothetical protein V3R95_06880 [Dehalococcoidia bacterium]
MATISESKARELFGDPRQASARLRAFRESARTFSSDHPRLIDAYPDEWVAVHGGDVKAHAITLVDLLDLIDVAELPRQELLVRFIEKNQRALIL